MGGAFQKSLVRQPSKDSAQEQKESNLKYSANSPALPETSYTHSARVSWTGHNFHTEALALSASFSKEVTQSKVHLKNIYRQLCRRHVLLLSSQSFYFLEGTTAFSIPNGSNRSSVRVVSQSQEWMQEGPS